MMLVGFIIGLFVGSAFGMLISAVLVASQETMKCMKIIDKKHNKRYNVCKI